MSTRERMTAAQAVVRYLTRQTVERDGQRWPFFEGIFGIFGHGNVAGMGEALETAQDDFRYMQARNEQAMVHAAVAFAKQHRRLRAFACTTSVGPGATNLVTGAAAATVNRIPVLLLPGDIFSTRRAWPVLQQLERPESHDVSVNDTLRPVSRFWDRINRPEQLVTALPAAIHTLLSPSDTGAVTLSLPEDVQVEAWDFPSELFEARVHVVDRQPPAPAAVARAAALLGAAERPLIVAGGGVLYSDASDALAAFASRYGIPVTETQAGKGALAWDHPQQAGPIGVNGGLAANRLARDADVVITIGTRLSDFTSASWTAWQHPDVRFISLNVAELDAYKAGAEALLGDARTSLDALGDHLAAAGWDGVSAGQRARADRLRDEWNAEVSRVRALSSDVHTSQPEAIRIVNDAARAGDVIVCAAGGLPGDLLRLWRTSEPGGYHAEYGYSTMGYEIAGGMGVKLAWPDAEVFVMLGDGSYLMLSAEIATAVQEHQKITIVVLDNHGFQCIANLSGACGGVNTFNEFNSRDESSGRLTGEPLPIDIAANAGSLGARVWTAHDPAQLSAALVEARASAEVSVIVAEVDPSVQVPGYESWWDVPVAEVSASENVRTVRAEYEVRRDKMRTHL